MLDTSFLAKCEPRQNGQLERAKTVKIGKIKWPPDKSEGLISHTNGENKVLTIERTNFPDPLSQSQYTTAAKIAAAQQELARTIGPKTVHGKNAMGTTYNTNMDSSTRFKPIKENDPQTVTTEHIKHSAKPKLTYVEQKNDEMKMETTHFPSITYLHQPWVLRARKEIFGALEMVSKSVVPIVYEQIMADLNDPRCFRLRPKDRKKLRKFLVHIGIVDQEDVSGKRKYKILEFVQENCPFYFMRIFPVANCRGIEFLGVSQKHITLGRTHLTAETKTILQAVHTFEHSEVENLEGEGNELEMTVKSLDKPLIMNSIYTDCIIDLAKDIALKNSKPSALFPESRPSTLKKDTVHELGRKGSMTNTNQLQTKDESLVDRFVSSMQLAAGSKNDTGLDTSSPQVTSNQKHEVVRTKHSLSDFAEFFHKKDETMEKQGFLHPLKLVASKAVSLPDVAKLRKKTSQLRWSSSPLKQPILSYKNVKIAQLALNCHVYIMSFMGDFNIGKRIQQRELVLIILKAGIEYKQLQDEIYCQLIMQTNSNKSAHHQSCFLGWRLFSIVSIFFPCTNMLQPYIFKYLQNCISSKTLNTVKDHSFLASFCLQVTNVENILE